MKRWAIVTVALYALFLLLLTAPLLLLGWLKYSHPADAQAAGRWIMEYDLGDVAELFRNWSYWVWLGVLVGAQALLLLVPIDVAERRPTSRRRLIVPVVVASFLLANLFLGGAVAILAAALGDKSSVVVEAPAEVVLQVIAHIPGLGAQLARQGLMPTAEMLALPQLVGMVLFFWLLWGLIFYRFARADDAESLVSRSTRWLLRGSILELLVAVPSHIIVRHREDCCAPYASFWGIVTGISVMLLSFGPGVLFLFAARIRRRRPRSIPPAPSQT